MAKKPEPPKPATWTIFKIAARQEWFGTLEAADEREAIQKAAEEFKQPMDLAGGIEVTDWNPWAPFPKDENGRCIARLFPEYQIDDALAHGWARLEPNSPHPLAEYGDWLWWAGEGIPWLPKE